MFIVGCVGARRAVNSSFMVGGQAREGSRF